MAPPPLDAFEIVTQLNDLQSIAFACDCYKILSRINLLSSVELGQILSMKPPGLGVFLCGGHSYCSKSLPLQPVQYL